MDISRRAFLNRVADSSMAAALVSGHTASAEDLETQLQRAAAQGGGDVSVAEGLIRVPRTLVVERNVNLYISRAVTLSAVADVSVVEVKLGGRLGGGGTIDFSQVGGFTQAGVLIRGLRPDQPNSHTVIGDLLIRGAGQPGSTGILLSATDPGTRITWVKVWGVDVIHAYRGVVLEADGGGKKVTWVNANQFQVDVQQPVVGWALYANGPKSQVTGNWFRSQVQSSRASHRALHCEGDYNQFDMFVWDWHGNVPGGTAVEFTPSSVRNEFSAPLLTQRDILDRGTGNRVALH